MALNLDALSSDGRSHYVTLGKTWGSGDTLSQAIHTLKALEKHAALLIAHGFTALDREDLNDGKQRLEAAGVTREGSRTGKKTTSTDHQAAIAAGKAARRRARRTLSATIGGARRAGGVPAGAVSEMGGTLDQTSRAGDAAALATHLELLAQTLAATGIAPAVASRGGLAAAAACTAAATAIRTSLATVAGPAGTPAETEMLNLLDGIIVELCREARAAAREASSATGNEAIAKEFDLIELERAASKAKPVVAS